MAIVDPMATLLTVCENGYGKRTELRRVPHRRRRGGIGIINIKTTDRNGKVVGHEDRPRRRRTDADHARNGMIVRTGMNETAHHRPGHAGRPRHQRSSPATSSWPSPAWWPRTTPRPNSR